MSIQLIQLITINCMNYDRINDRINDTFITLLNSIQFTSIEYEHRNQSILK